MAARGSLTSPRTAPHCGRAGYCARAPQICSFQPRPRSMLPGLPWEPSRGSTGGSLTSPRTAPHCGRAGYCARALAPQICSFQPRPRSMLPGLPWAPSRGSTGGSLTSPRMAPHCGQAGYCAQTCCLPSMQIFQPNTCPPIPPRPSVHACCLAWGTLGWTPGRQQPPCFAHGRSALFGRGNLPSSHPRPGCTLPGVAKGPTSGGGHATRRSVGPRVPTLKHPLGGP